MLLSFGLLIAGLVCLVLAGDYLVRGTVAAALKLGVSQILASVLIVGFGTSAPEMLVALEATLVGTPGLAVGNIIGSNIANVLLVVGVPALLISLKTTGAGLLRSTIFTAIATIVWLIVTPIYGLTPMIGVLFLFGLLLYITGSLIRPPTENPEDLVSDEVKEPPPGWALTAFFILLGVLGLPLGSHLAIMGATGIANQVAWLNDELVGLTLLALGTSMPEFAAAMAAARRKETDVVFGNVVGSNMFNILGAGGIVALFGPIELPGIFLQFDHFFLAGAFAIVSLYVVLKRPIGWMLGLCLLAAYIAYLFGLHHFYILGLNWSEFWT